MSAPLVSVICLCYNHKRFVREAIESVLNQTYSRIEIIVVDDASTDGSVEIIQQLVAWHPSIQFLPLKKNLGNCRAFNRGLALATGEYVIDLATDDILMSERIEKQVQYFERLGTSYGVVFTDATYVDERGDFIQNHYEYLFSKGLLEDVPQGDVFSVLISRYFIASPTMMIRKDILDKLHGYDEELSYEDFDFWMRASRISRFGFLDERVTAIRKTRSSMSKGWYKIGDTQVHSTYLVCLKIVKMLRSDEERLSLLKRLQYELRQCVFSHNRTEAILFYNLLEQLNEVRLTDRLALLVLKSGIPVTWIRNLYHRLRYS